MGAAVLSALAFAAVSAFLPVAPVEPYLVALAAGGQPVLAVSVAAAVGQTAGKVLIFLAARRTLRSDRLRRWLSRRVPERLSERSRLRRLLALLDRPALVVPTILASAVTGLPPLLAVSVHAARTRVSAPVFALCCLAGRAARFTVVMLVPGLL
jgi:membrane protein YqaA with SNARE-associated domain